MIIRSGDSSFNKHFGNLLSGFSRTYINNRRPSDFLQDLQHLFFFVLRFANDKRKIITGKRERETRSSATGKRIFVECQLVKSDPVDQGKPDNMPFKKLFCSETLLENVNVSRLRG